MKLLRVFILLFICIFLIGCAKKKPYTKSGFYFDTVVTITLYDSSKSNLIDDCFKMCEKFENKFSPSIEFSDISRINNSNGIPVKVSDETIELLEKGIYYGELSDGSFDITVAPLTSLWDFSKDNSKIPQNEDIETALAYVNYQNIEINGNQVILRNPHTEIDLGGIAKGYIADRLKEYLSKNGVKSAIINLGGNVVTVGNSPDNIPFEIGISKPFDNSSERLLSVSSSNSSVVTSGIYERCFTSNDVLYHHILDTSTGYPCETDLLSATILSENSIDGDALSTICITLGSEKAIELINRLNDIDAILITTDYEIIDTRK